MVGGIAAMGTSQAARFALQILSTVILARLLPPGDFGLVALAFAVTATLSVVADAGLSYPVIQRQDISPSQVSTLFWASLGLGIAMTAILWSVGPFLAHAYGDPRLGPVMATLALGFALGGASAQQRALMARNMRFKTLAAIPVAGALFGVATGLAMALTGWGPWSLVGQSLASQVIETAALWTLAGWRPSRPAWAVGTAPLIATGARIGAFNLINHFARSADNFLVGWVWGNAALGLYAKAYQLIMLPLQQLSGPVASVTVPALSRLAGIPDRYRTAYLRALTQLVMAIYPLYALLAVTSGDVVLAILGPQWDQASRVFLALAVSAIAQPVCNSLGWLYLSSNRTGAMLRNTSFTAACLCGAFAVGLPWGPAGVALAYSLSLLAIAPWMVHAACTGSPIRPRSVYAACVPGLLGGGAMGVGSALALTQREIVGYGLSAVVAATAAGGLAASLAYVIVPAARRELSFLSRHFPYPNRNRVPA